MKNCEQGRSETKEGLPDCEAVRQNAGRLQAAEPSYLLEYVTNSVTLPTNEDGARFEVSKCRCDCWFCPECCEVMGFTLRKRLIPLLKTFKGLMMVTLTIDPKLFPDPHSAFLYAMDRRCISRTTQDLDRWGYLHTRRYFYVLEWQKKTEMVHFHILYDASYIPFDKLLESWDKHRPKEAGPVEDNRPAFGTVLFSAPKFADHVHAARYATKYLIKSPDHGYPAWVMGMGSERRIRRYSTSRGFWNTPSKSNKGPPLHTRKRKLKTYAERIGKCGDSLHVFEITETINKDTGEIKNDRLWLGQIKANADIAIDGLFDPGNEKRRRRSLLAENSGQVQEIIEIVTKKEAPWIARRGAKC